jgi:hypothetical protein
VGIRQKPVTRQGGSLNQEFRKENPKYKLVEELINWQAEEGENSNREWVIPKDTYLKAGQRRDEG